MAENKPGPSAQRTGYEHIHDAIDCPGCREGVMVKRTGKFGPFFGCSRYPKCTQTLDMRGMSDLVDPPDDEPYFGE